VGAETQFLIISFEIGLDRRLITTAETEADSHCKGEEPATTQVCSVISHTCRNPSNSSTMSASGVVEKGFDGNAPEEDVLAYPLSQKNRRSFGPATY